MIYFGGITLGHFHLYPVGFQPKDTAADAGAADEAGRSRLAAAMARLFRPAARNRS